MMAPTPRYIKNGCCENLDHASNIESMFYEEKIHRVFRTFISTLARTIMPPGTWTEDGLSIWLSRDPVHLTNAPYIEIGIALLNGDVNDVSLSAVAKAVDGSGAGTSAAVSAGTRGSRHILSKIMFYRKNS